jgi:hypothetical protein
MFVIAAIYIYHITVVSNIWFDFYREVFWYYTQVRKSFEHYTILTIKRDVIYIEKKEF